MHKLKAKSYSTLALYHNFGLRRRGIRSLETFCLCAIAVVMLLTERGADWIIRYVMGWLDRAWSWAIVYLAILALSVLSVVQGWLGIEWQDLWEMVKVWE